VTCNAKSIEDQIVVAKRYAEQHHWTVSEDHVYTDAGISGASLEGRPGIQRLLSVAVFIQRPFDVVLVDDSSRVARDLRDALHVMRLLKFSGVRTIYISQQIDSANEQAETLLTVHGLVDGLYLQEMAKKIRRGLAGQLARGFHTGSRSMATAPSRCTIRRAKATRTAPW
jgi:DNA invertase Pin-like site-specific DNA recombinase